MPRIRAPACLDSIALRAHLLLLALLTTRTGRRPLAPTVALTIALLDELEGGELIEVDWRPTVPIAGDDSSQLRWRLAADLAEVQDLPKRLAAQLNAPALTSQLREACLPLWQDLVEAEATAFHRNALCRQGWNPDWARDITFIAAQLPARLSILRWRACTQIAITAGCDMGEGARPEARREAIYGALLHHALQPFAPAHGPTRPSPLPVTALARVMVPLVSLQNGYGRAPPTRDALEHAVHTRHGRAAPCHVQIRTASDSRPRPRQR